MPSSPLFNGISHADYMDRSEMREGRVTDAMRSMFPTRRITFDNKCIGEMYWNSTSGFDFDHTTAADMSFCTSLRNFIQIGPPSAEKNDVMSIFKIADLSHLGF